MASFYISLWAFDMEQGLSQVDQLGPLLISLLSID